jgi:Leucine-rich repeat (LRR) protein
VLPSLARLEVLSVAGNDIASAAELDCPLLHDINLSRNKLDSFDFLRACSSLKTLNASRNAITTLCTKLRSLTTLNVSWNALTRLDGVHYYTHLKNLHAAFNDLASVNSIVGTLKQLGLLEVIDLKANPCTQMFYP